MLNLPTTYGKRPDVTSRNGAENIALKTKQYLSQQLLCQKKAMALLVTGICVLQEWLWGKWQDKLSLTTGVDLQQTVAALIGGIVKRKKGSSWGTAFTWGLNYAASWEWIVDKIFDMVQNALDFSTARSKWPRQSRSLWQIPVAAALLVSSSLPLVKAIKRARSIEVKSDQLLPFS